MLIKLHGTKITRTIKSNNLAIIEAHKKQDPSLIELTDYNFTESVDLYEYVNDTIQLKSGWEGIKQDRYLATLPSLIEAKKDNLIKTLDVKSNEVEENDIIEPNSGLTIATDLKSQTKLALGITLFGRKPLETRLVEVKDGFVNINKQQSEDIQDALDAHMTSVVTNKKLHSDAILSIVDAIDTDDEQKVIALNDYDINTGW